LKPDGFESPALHNFNKTDAHSGFTVFIEE
jgi:hypothetical protein